MDITILLDGKTGVSSKQLAMNMIKAAFIALEGDGNIELELNASSKKKPGQVKVIPTGKGIHFPEKTLESTFLPSRTRTVFDIVFEWLGDKSMSPWSRAVELGLVNLTLRKFSIINGRTILGKKYIFSDAGHKQVTLDKRSEETLSMLDQFRENRTPIWRAMDLDIALAIKKRVYKQKSEDDHYIGSDPWQSVKEEHKSEAGLETAKIKSAHYSITIAMGMIAWAGLIYTIRSLDQLIPSLIMIAGMISIVGLYYLKFTPIVGFLDWVGKTMREKQENQISYNNNLVNQLSGTFFVIPVLTVVIILISQYFAGGYTIPVLLIFAFTVFAIFKYLSFKSRVVLKEKILDSSKTDIKNTGDHIHDEPIPEIVNYTEIDIELKMADPTQSSRISESDYRPNLILKRGKAYFSAYKRILIFIACSGSLLATLYWVLTPDAFLFGSESSIPLYFPFYIYLFGVLTIILATPRFSSKLFSGILGRILSGLTGGDVSVDSDKQQDSKNIRPIGLIILTWVWMIVLLIQTNSTYIFGTLTNVNVVFSFLSLVCIVATYIWIIRSKRYLEKKFPYQAPLVLFELSGYGSNNFQAFNSAIVNWDFLGSTFVLNDNSEESSKPSDVMKYLTGDTDAAIIKNTEELQKVTNELIKSPNRNLRFPTHQINCLISIREEVIQKLTALSDIVVMDVSGYEDRQRMIQDIHVLYNHIPEERILFLVDDSMDRKELETIFQSALQTIKSEHSSTGKKDFTPVLLDISALSDSIESEEFEKSDPDRQKKLFNAILIRYLYKLSQPPRSDQHVDPVKDAKSIKWTGLPISKGIKSLVKIGILIFFILTLIRVLYF